MECLKFKLSGRTAFFKKPDVNSNLYFTYGCIHKVALLGIFGAILGYSGYNQMKDTKNKYPEFYDKLRGIKIAISPNNSKGHINKKIQRFNNSVGYASQEQGGNLIVSEQWLENPSWFIYLLIDSDEAKLIEDSVVNHKAIYSPYLGTNDHYADIKDIELLDVDVVDNSNYLNINTLMSKLDFNISDDFDEDDYEDEGIIPFKYQEKLPIALDETTNLYKFESFFYTNMKVVNKSNAVVYKAEDKNIVFY